MKREYLLLDFEFYNSRHPNYTLVCCHTLYIGSGKTTEKSFWLHGGDLTEFKSYMRLARVENCILVAWVASAELRCLLSAGIDIDPFKIIDVQVEYKLFCNSSAIFEARRDLNSAYRYFYNQTISDKEDTRDLILSAEQGYKYTPADMIKIQEYCRQDVLATRDVFKCIAGYLTTTYGLRDTYIDDAIRRGEYVKATTYVERNGYPINLEMLKKVGHEFDNIQLAFIKNASERLRKCYVLETKSKLYKIEKFVFKKEIFDQTVRDLGLEKMWQKTPTGKSFTTDARWLKDHVHVHPFIEELHSTKRKVDCLKYLRPKTVLDRDKKTLYDVLGDDNRVRCWVNPFGTTTGRNAPPATGFIPAQASWERVLIRPQPSRVILGFDYSGQEVLISALVGQDENMKQSYASGDPYIAFGKYAGRVPREATKDTHADIRDKILKPVILGLGYGMGATKLSRQLGVDEQEGYNLYADHQRIYASYWNNSRQFIQDYQDKDLYYRLSDDWGFRNLSNYGTLLNWRAQSWGGRILRALAVELTKKTYRERKLDLIILLHDAVYIEVDDSLEIDYTIKEIRELMIKIFHSFLPSDVSVRVDCKEHRHDDFWIEKKAKDTWEAIKQFLI